MIGSRDRCALIRGPARIPHASFRAEPGDHRRVRSRRLGKSTLARALAERVGVPAILRDEIKQAMVAATEPRDGDYEDLNLPVLHAFVDVLIVLARAGVSTIAEAAFQDRLWRPNLLRVAEFAEIRIIHCTAPRQVLCDRVAHRVEHDPHRRAHNDVGLLDAIAAGTRGAESFVEPRLVAGRVAGARPPGCRARRGPIPRSRRARGLRPGGSTGRSGRDRGAEPGRVRRSRASAVGPISR
ncbi:AAA family ATPase [Nocardia farcinica]|uniref:AAA family ATPase n=1 Tax=Nocardia farcinica TaxID=37329 RepID=UPI0018945EAB|nr:AAA family ATPase [Nocardia farcinica]MBF6422911.1 AAA family ATPase [Nocardia farcinica]MBF6434516.1 AAA family ATPase [Nocardia farcinica]MBF6505601.1 AAA family ATPase [Nocardia farcinica]